MAEGHRQRLKDRFLHDGLDNFNEINALELLLFYAVPRVDTNPLAHRLLDRFGSFANVLEADYNALLDVEGVSEHTATYIKLLQSSARYFQMNRITDTKELKTQKDIGQYLCQLYFGLLKETVYMILLDNKDCIISVEKVHEGSVNSASVDIRRMAEIALTKRASSVVLAHNHPSGHAIPSADDRYITRCFKTAMSSLGIYFIDHFVIAEDKYCTILNPPE